MSFGNDPSAPVTYASQQNVDAILKELYGDLTNELYTERPFLAMMPKDEGIEGRFYNQTIHSSAGQAIGATFTNLQTFAGLSGEGFFDFQVPKVELQAVANVSNKAIREAGSKKGAVVEIVQKIVDGQMENGLNVTALKLFRSADFSLGNVGGSVAGTTLTFANQADAINIQLGQFLDFAATNSGTTIRALAANNTSCQVTAIDQIGGTATVKWNGTGTQTLTANNVQVGDYIYISSFKSLGFNGTNDWIPFGGVTSTDLFNGVNRSFDVVKLAGSYLDGTGGNIEEILENGAAQVYRLGGKLSDYVMTFGQYRQLANAQGSKVQILNVVDQEAHIGFEAISVNAGRGNVKVFPDRSVPSNLILGTDISSWKLISSGPIYHLWQEDGKAWLRSYNQGGMEVRFYSLGNLVCMEPRNSVNIRCLPLL